jgi:hypothetical protein
MALEHFGQYQGAWVLTGLGLLLRQLAQRYRLPFTAVFGRTLFPVLGKLLGIVTSNPRVSNSPDKDTRIAAMVQPPLSILSGTTRIVMGISNSHSETIHESAIIDGL